MRLRIATDLRKIRDDTLRDLFNKEFAPDASVFCLIDCCHSGSMLDLPHTLGVQPPRRAPGDKPESVTGTDLYMLSGCRDDQTSADAHNEKAGKFGIARGQANGALTSAFLQNIQPQATVSDLVSGVRSSLRRRNHGRRGVFTQVPQFTSNRDMRGATRLVLPFF